MNAKVCVYTTAHRRPLLGVSFRRQWNLGIKLRLSGLHHKCFYPREPSHGNVIFKINVIQTYTNFILIRWGTTAGLQERSLFSVIKPPSSVRAEDWVYVKAFHHAIALNPSPSVSWGFCHDLVACTELSVHVHLKTKAAELDRLMMALVWKALHRGHLRKGVRQPSYLAFIKKQRLASHDGPGLWSWHLVENLRPAWVTQETLSQISKIIN